MKTLKQTDLQIPCERKSVRQNNLQILQRNYFCGRITLAEIFKQMPTKDFRLTCGLEIHVRLASATKLFCNCSNETFAAEPNSHVCPVCMAFPGALPVVNESAVHLGVKLALALGCKIAQSSRFDRKSYFYPDLPAGFQISQFFQPIAENGQVEFFNNGEKKSVRINRLHLENDAGKLVHAGKNSLVDLNRAGSPLAEIVTEPDFEDPQDVFEFLKNLQRICRFCKASQADMEKGQMRCDVNISVRKKDQQELGVKVEIKNMNSFANARKAVEFEFARQAKLLSRGERIHQQTRGFNAEKGTTHAQRSKEESADYRYFPEPDLPAVQISEKQIAQIRAQLPTLPAARLERFLSEFALPLEQAETLADDLALADFFENANAVANNPRKTANWILGEFLQHLKSEGLTCENCKMSPESLGKLVQVVESGQISGKIAKEIFPEIFKSGADPEQFCRERNLVQLQDTGEIQQLCQEVCQESPQIVADFKNGKTKAMGALVGLVMKKSQGKANPKLVNQVLQQML